MSFSDRFYNIWWGQKTDAKKAGLSHFLFLIDILWLEVAIPEEDGQEKFLI